MTGTRALFVTVAVAFALTPLRVQSFTYQGRLTESGAPVNGIYDLRFRLAVDSLGSSYLPDSFVTNGVVVSGGVFTVTLAFDSNVFLRSNLWLQVDVRTGAATDYTTLVPLQPLTPAPYAIIASSAGNLHLSGELAADGLRVTNASTFSGTATFDAAVMVNSSLAVSNDLIVRGTITMKDGVVYVPPGGEITNVFQNLSNNMHIVLLTGTSVVSTFQYGVGVPHLLIQHKTNITIEGLGWQSVVFTGQTGSVFGVFGSSNITFRNFAVIGTRGPIGHEFGTQFAAFDIRETCYGLTWDGMLIKDHHDLGITQLSLPRDAYDCTVRNCTFINIGSTNAIYPTLRMDGAAIVVLGSRMKILNNRFYDCAIAVEFEGAPGIMDGGGVRNVLVHGNQIYNNLGVYAIGSFGLANHTNWEHIVVSDNIIHFNKQTYWNLPGPGAVGIRFIGGCRSTIKGNIIRDAYSGIVIADGSNTAPMEDWVIANNVVYGMGLGAGIQVVDSNRGIKGCLVSGNIIRDCGSDGMWIGGVNHLVSGNLISHCGTNAAQGSGIRLIGIGTMGSCSNLIIGNSIQPGSRTSQFYSQYAIKVEGGSTNNLIRDNWLAGYEVAPFHDAGVRTVLLNNTIDQHLAVRHAVLDATFTTNCTSGMTIGRPQSLRMRLSAASPVILHASTSIEDGYYDGQTLDLIGTSDVNTVEIPDSSNVQLNGGTSKTLGRGDVLRLVWDTELGDWLQTAPLSDN